MVAQVSKEQLDQRRISEIILNCYLQGINYEMSKIKRRI